MSYNFKEICQFRVGEQYWECNQYNNINFEVTTEPVVENGKVWFNAIDIKTQENIQYLMTEGFEHYGPRIYDFEAYVDLSDLQGRQ